MALSTVHKVQLLLLLSFLAIGCYFYIIHKDLEHYVGELHEKVQYLLKVAESQSNQKPQEVTLEKTKIPQVTEATTTTIRSHVHADNTMDDVSVSSKDIKDLLTNIYQEPDDEIEIIVEDDNDVEDDTGVKDDMQEQEQEQVHVEEVDISVQSHVAPADFSKMTDAEIMNMKYDDLRNYLRKHGVHMKGPKATMLAKIRELTTTN